MLAPWLKAFDILDPIRAGASLGLSLRQQNNADDDRAERRQQAAEALNERYASLAQQAANQQALREQARLNATEALRHNQAQEAGLNTFRQSQASHWTNQEAQAAENAAALEERRRDQDEAKMHVVEPVVRNIPGFGNVLVNPKTGNIHTPPSDSAKKLEDAFDRADYNAAARAFRHVDTPTAEKDQAGAKLKELRDKTRLGFTPSKGGVVNENAPILSDMEAAAALHNSQAPSGGTKSVRMRAPNGSMAMVPTDQVNAAKAAGAVIVE